MGESNNLRMPFSTTRNVAQYVFIISVYTYHFLTMHLMKKVEQEYGKSFNFLKQHASQHVIQDIKEKGTVDNFSTRVGEGVQQEASQAFEQTNMKNAEHQVSI